jgi:Protein of unknown function (DUF3592)
MTPSTATSNPAGLPPELAGAVPRDVRLTVGGLVVASLAVAAAVGALVAGIVMTLVYMRASDERQLRRRDGVMADAAVVQVVEKRGDGPHRVVTYRYDVNGRSYTGRTALRNGDRRVLRSGAPIRIGFVREQPDRSWMIGYEPSGFPLWLIPLSVFSLVAVAAALVRSVRRQWILLSEGRAARARVTASKKVSSDKGKRYRVTYEFQTLSGARQQSRCDIGKTPPAIGAIIPVVYHRDRPDWSATYPLQLVRPGRLVS